jgi:hypothetical protein
MTRKVGELRQESTPEQRERSRERTAALLLAMDLAELRGRARVTQEELASRLQISQSNVSRLERRRDMLISTLREVVRRPWIRPGEEPGIREAFPGDRCPRRHQANVPPDHHRSGGSSVSAGDPHRRDATTRPTARRWSVHRSTGR